MKQNEPKLKKELISFVRVAVDMLDEFKCAENEFVCGDFRYKITVRRKKI